MSEVSFSEIVIQNREMKKKLCGLPFRIVVLTNITVNLIKDILEYQLGIEGIKADVIIGDYDNILQDAEKYSDSDAVIIFWEAANYIPSLSYMANLLSNKEIDELLNKCKLELQLLFRILENVPLVLFNRFSSLAFNYNQVQPDNFDLIVDSMNSILESCIGKNVQIVNIDRIIGSIGVSSAISPQNYYIHKALYTLNMMKVFTSQIKHPLIFLRGKIKKMLILDCDNTLWPGVVGEDGVEGILEKYETPIGYPYRDVQTIIAALIKRGVLVGICSKNNDEDVKELFLIDKTMRLSENDLCIRKVNWEEKHINIINMANTLNIGLDSIVFVDDSDFEVNLIRKMLPEVDVVQVPRNLYEYPAIIRKLANSFFGLVQTLEDAQRLKMYQLEDERMRIKNEFESLDDYLRYLQLSLSIRIDPLFKVARLSQLTQKTNQFNLTTYRYSETEMRKFIASEYCRVYAIDVSDRFGDAGTVGLLIIKFDSNGLSASIDTFLLSCRVMGRKIEFAFFESVISDLKKSGIKILYGEYIPTVKNIPVSNLYEQLGFILLITDNGVKKYSYDLNLKLPNFCDYVNKEFIYD